MLHNDQKIREIFDKVSLNELGVDFEEEIGWEKINQRIHIKPKHSLGYYLPYAAAVFLGIFISLTVLYFGQNSNRNHTELISIRKQQIKYEYKYRDTVIPAMTAIQSLPKTKIRVSKSSDTSVVPMPNKMEEPVLVVQEEQVSSPSVLKDTILKQKTLKPVYYADIEEMPHNIPQKHFVLISKPQSLRSRFSKPVSEPIDVQVSTDMPLRSLFFAYK